MANERRNEMITKQQSKSIEKIKKLAETLHGEYADKYEIKKFEIDDNEYFVSVAVTIGLKNDEGTAAASFGRDYAHLFIGKRGGISYPVSKRMKDGSYKHYEKRFEGYSLLQAIVDQK